MLVKFYNSLISFFNGFVTVFKHLFKKSVTEEYPEQQPFLNVYFRGKHILENCIGCGFCQKVCPSNAISISKKENIIESYIIDYKKCIFCGNCMYYCPTKSIKMTKTFELATNNQCVLNVNLIQKREKNEHFN